MAENLPISIFLNVIHIVSIHISSNKEAVLASIVGKTMIIVIEGEITTIVISAHDENAIVLPKSIAKR